jgi:hypothetical protein
MDAKPLGPRCLTLSEPRGIGPSILAKKLPRQLPQTMTARNLRTVAALHEKAADT